MLTRPLPYEATEAQTKEAEAKTRFFGQNQVFRSGDQRPSRPETEFREFRKFKEVIMQAFANHAGICKSCLF